MNNPNDTTAIISGSAQRRRPPSSSNRPPRSLLRVLLVEDDGKLRAVSTHALNRLDYDVTRCRREIDFWVLLVSSDASEVFAAFDLVVCNVRLLNEVGARIIQGLQQRSRYPPLVLIDQSGDSNRNSGGLELAARIDSPFELAEWLVKIREIAPQR